VYRAAGKVLPHERFDERDEVRLAYVAMTRTTERLFLTYHRESGFAKRLLAASATPAAGAEKPGNEPRAVSRAAR
jgi:superfamily I DNA/RNA helicase